MSFNPRFEIKRDKLEQYKELTKKKEELERDGKTLSPEDTQKLTELDKFIKQLEVEKQQQNDERVSKGPNRHT